MHSLYAFCRKKLAADPYFYGALAFTCAVTAFMYWLIMPEAAGRYHGLDSYLRLVKVEQLLSGGGWYNETIARVRPPEGSPHHWTRLYDIVIAIFAAPMIWLKGLHEGLFISGFWLAPFLQLIVAGFYYKIGRLFLSPIWAFASVALLVSHSMMQIGGMPGYPDHHMFAQLLDVLAYWGLLSGMVQGRKSGFYIAGFALAMGLWVLPIALLSLLIVTGTLSLSFLITGKRLADYARVTLALLCGGLLAFILEHPPEKWFSVVQYDRFSQPQLFLLFLFAVTGGLAAFCAAKKKVIPAEGRFVILAAFGAIIGGEMALAFPLFFKGPLVDMPSIMTEAFLNRIPESSGVPLYPQHWGQIIDISRAYIPLMLAVPGLVVLLRDKSKDARFFWGLAMLVTAALPFYQARFFYQSLLCLAVPMGAGVQFLAARIAPRRQGCFLAVLLLLLSVPMQNLVSYPFGFRMKHMWETMPAHEQAFRHLAEKYPDAKGLLSNPFSAPVALWMTPFSVQALPTHRSYPAFLHVEKLWGEGDMVLAERQLKEAGVDLILIGIREHPFTGMFQPFPTDSLHGRLWRGEPLSWLEPIDLPEETIGKVRAYKRIDRP